MDWFSGALADVKNIFYYWIFGCSKMQVNGFVCSLLGDVKNLSYYDAV